MSGDYDKQHILNSTYVVCMHFACQAERETSGNNYEDDIADDDDGCACAGALSKRAAEEATAEHGERGKETARNDKKAIRADTLQGVRVIEYCIFRLKISKNITNKTANNATTTKLKEEYHNNYLPLNYNTFSVRIFLRWVHGALVDVVFCVFLPSSLRPSHSRSASRYGLCCLQTHYTHLAGNGDE